MSEVIPVDVSSPETVQVTNLDQVPYELRFSWSDRSDSWYLSVSIQREGDDPTPILTGVRIAVGYPPLAGLVGPDRPLGEILPIDVSDPNGAGTDPTRYDLGTRVVLLYVTGEELGRVAS